MNNTNFFFLNNCSNNDTIKSYNKNYHVLFTNDTLNDILNKYHNENDFIIMDKYIFETYSPNKKIDYILDATEQNKTIDTSLLIIDLLNNINFNKKNKLIIVGGGITQDISGFASAIYKRGVDWIFIPTTLLSMTDSCIGGKVGINRKSKNILGMFVSPNEIIISSSFLKTLNDEQIISGLGEALKLSMIGGKLALKNFIECYYKKDYMTIIKNATSIKKVIIEKDELEKCERKVLNYGHTIGHAIESASNYFIPHGIAVLIGMYLINKIFHPDKFTDENKLIINLIDKKFLNIKIVKEDVMKHILNDKKNVGDLICFIVLDEIGKTTIKHVHMENIKQTIINELDNLFGK